MQDKAPLPPFAAVIVAAGKGLRAGQPLPKQFALWRGKPVLRHSVDTLLAAGAAPLVIAIPENGEEPARAALAGLEGYALVVGGATRQESVARALDAVGSAERVLIHDAARPNLPQAVIERLLGALDSHPGAIPVLPVVDSLSRDENGLMIGTAPREELRRVQTPQAFRYDEIRAAHANWQGDAEAGDDAQVLRAAGGAVAHVAGDERLAKLTFAEDFMTELPPVRMGMGYDVHRLAAGEELWLGGIRIEHDKGLAGHSDADVALHAIVDALLGAIANGDIGSHFPPGDPQWKGASSERFLAHAAKLVGEAGYRVGNIDLTIICEAPKIGPHREAMRTRIAELLGVDIGAVSVKATTTERLGFAGRGEGIAAQAVATVLSN
ncbi:bifunctional 2-C-methyl-D-erythritol 4-phosphate cytidylyltransferase/2-C-methyl-D-erythritol 2,4-cyclodiphosphate synthase [Qipengyuania flava]|uniref:bifunctional 2-C-methyl-D-erythritol 4-phosphate cytidylyltransferase/2-C-methyl-D-erythritol 2,4-cyclodiphosphate synthase n=1 Tax=Qipengyuania flava TaxID=192812 RepID=UPI001C63986B|nr:bifunctional 2-C-methyl-D-erythritol 4-phosphate cytidylyltransferase/2-C-methyl-D-erythritol 2,4-cyclodiphosphate synthase [Qipengyuania flava]QYJ06090.1 bifunctional 2-C-methyl-D-erythritol 4-phosphate cytidylyltransferase/2-C-methyl-D-erythritol 2,4-cyclodiphosphate synthase [Qipengyuania flava]